MHELVFGSTQQRMARGITPAGVVDQRLGMLDPNPNREGLALHGDTGPVEHREGVASGMTGSQNHLTAIKAAAIGQFQAGDLKRLAVTGAG